MKIGFLKLATAAALLLPLATGSALAASDKAKKQAEVRSAAQTALADFYKAKPELKAQVQKAPGYGVFTTYGLSFLVGGAGGSGLVHNNKTKANTYMDMAQGSLGLQVGASQSRTLIVFKDAKSMQQFIDKGWEFGGGGGAAAGVAGKDAGAATGGTVSGAEYYTLTPNGIQVGGAATGTKFWKSKELN
ncbi:MAG: YSC84-related protein [Burkholderiales bacterium]|jgi:lipid-binding SYLF domain-containing protein|nr:YSC84-related protein [Burkholderiales bacterium]